MIEKRNWLIEFTEQYSQFFEKCNWYTFNFAHIEVENDVIMGGVEITFIVMGLGFRWRWNYMMTDNMQFCIDTVKDIKEKEKTE